jgi:O-antigen/teichoic acid export membrane protein
LQKLIIRNIFWRGLYFLSLFGLNILISRHFKAEGSGWIYYVINNLSFLILALSLSLESGVAFYVSNGQVSAQKISFFCLAWSVIAASFGLLFMNWMIPSSYPVYLSRTELITGCFCYCLGVLLTTYFLALFFARQVFRLPNLLLLFFNLLLIFLFFIYRNERYVLDHFMILYFVSFLLQGLVMTAAFFIRINSNGAEAETETKYPDWARLAKIFKYSLLALAGNLVFFLICRVDYWFVKKFCSFADLGNYIQVSKLVQVLILVPSIMASTIFPLVAGGQKEEVNKALKILTRCLLFGIGIVCLIIAIVGKWAFPFIFGTSFLQMHALFLLLIPGVLALSAHYPLTAYYAGKHRIMVNIKGSLLALMLIITGDLIFIPIAGVMAAPLISSIGYACYYFYVLFTFSKDYQTSVAGFFMLKRSDLAWVKKMVSL